MGFKPKYHEIWMQAKFFLTCTILSIYGCATEIHMLVSSVGFKLSQKEVNSMLHKPFSSIQYELWVWFEKQATSRCFASLL